MKFRNPSFCTVATISYVLFAVSGVGVWYVLLTGPLPKGSNAVDALRGLLALDPGGEFMKFHMAATLLAAAFAITLILKPPIGVTACLVTAIIAVLLAACSWTVFNPDTASLPTVAAGALVWGWFKASRTATK